MCPSLLVRFGRGAQLGGAMISQGSSMDTLLSPQKQLQKQLPPDIAMAGAQWGCYSSPAALDGLLEWLNPKGEQPSVN